MLPESAKEKVEALCNELDIPKPLGTSCVLEYPIPILEELVKRVKALEDTVNSLQSK